MSSKVSDEVLALVEPIARDFGLDVVEVEYAKKNNGMNLTIFIDKDGGVNIQDCERLHRAIDGPLDDLDPTSGSPYILNVSSLGLDRPLKTDRDLDRYIGKEVDIKTYVNVDKRKLFIGKLVSYDADTLSVEVDNSIVNLSRDKIAVVVPHIKF